MPKNIFSARTNYFSIELVNASYIYSTDQNIKRKKKKNRSGILHVFVLRDDVDTWSVNRDIQTLFRMRLKKKCFPKRERKDARQQELKWQPVRRALYK